MTSCLTLQERAVAINPTRSCAPIGAMLANYGIHGAITINHGSQGCATYPRHQMSRHFREPVEVATTSLTEKTTVYGGKQNPARGAQEYLGTLPPDHDHGLFDLSLRNDRGRHSCDHR
jgi:nitrogenase molybdenum-iron protein alpha/beta subunit